MAHLGTFARTGGTVKMKLSIKELSIEADDTTSRVRLGTVEFEGPASHPLASILAGVAQPNGHAPQLPAAPKKGNGK